MGKEEQGASTARYGPFDARYKDKLRGGNKPPGAATATAVRVRDGRA